MLKKFAPKTTTSHLTLRWVWLGFESPADFLVYRFRSGPSIGQHHVQVNVKSASDHLKVKANLYCHKYTESKLPCVSSAPVRWCCNFFFAFLGKYKDIRIEGFFCYLSTLLWLDKRWDSTTPVRKSWREENPASFFVLPPWYFSKPQAMAIISPWHWHWKIARCLGINKKKNRFLLSWVVCT